MKISDQLDKAMTIDPKDNLSQKEKIKEYSS
jgi:hypothetical protein